ncbi:MAG: polyphosphate kinase 1 [Solirubrobacterales bacterium]|nr:polyphosphate kinase 1 [Solirubrobacterales bacterium]
MPVLAQAAGAADGAARLRTAGDRGHDRAKALGSAVRRPGADRRTRRRAVGRARSLVLLDAPRPDGHPGEDAQRRPRGDLEGRAGDAAAPERACGDRDRRRGDRVTDRALQSLDAPAATTDGRPTAPKLSDPSLYTNRELSWLDFNDRVLQLAEDESLPLIERVKFLAIFVTNLDEFFMVRVAGVHDQLDARIDARGPDGLSPSETLERIADRVRELDQRHARQYSEVIRPALARRGIKIIGCAEASAPAGAIERHFREQIFPVLTPLAVGPGRPFPYISNLSLSLIVRLNDPELDSEVFARVKVPKEVLPRFVEITKDTFIPLEEIIAANLGALFPGMEIVSFDLFRVTRDADFEVSDEADDLLQAVEDELRRRRFGEVVRLEVGASMEPALRTRLIEWLAVDEVQVYDVDGLLDLGDLWELAGLEGHSELRQAPWTPLTHPAFRSEPSDRDDQPDVFEAMRATDVLVHYPYHSFSSSVERFVKQAVDDPSVLAIKMTVYRTSDDSALVPSLIQAAERGKQAVCMVELKARFDERLNIRWSRALEEVGAHVVHGIPGLKTHAKAILVVRREREGVRHYVMIGTGNFHAKNARLYEDFGLFTTDPEIGQEVANLFNTLTGYGHPERQRKVLVAPGSMREPLIEEIDSTIAAHEAGEEARIAMKMNSLVDRRCIEALYRASQAGVPIDLNVRGICGLIPGIPGVSETINVVSVVGRFLEHSRIYSFQRGDEHDVYIGSADLMPRNLDTRVELLVPIDDLELRAELADTLERCLADDTFAWTLGPDARWQRREGATRSVHRELMERTLAQSASIAT